MDVQVGTTIIPLVKADGLDLRCHEKEVVDFLTRILCVSQTDVHNLNGLLIRIHVYSHITGHINLLRLEDLEFVLS